MGDKTLGVIRVPYWLCVSVLPRQVCLGKQGATQKKNWLGVLSEISLHQLKGTTTICIWTISTVTLICSLNGWTLAFIAVAQSELEGKDFLKIFLLQKLTKSACPGAITSLESMINLLLWAGLTGVGFTFSQQFTHLKILMAPFQLYHGRMGVSKSMFHVPLPKWTTKSTWVGWTYQISLSRPFLWSESQERHGRSS